MTHQNPDTISFDLTGELEVPAESANIRVIIEGESSVFGNEALSKSKEIADFISSLDSFHYDTKHLSIENISINNESGKILKSTQAKYTLRLKKIALEMMPKIVEAIARQKNIKLQNLDYDFGDLNQAKTTLLKQVCANAKIQAKEVCETFGVPLIAIHSMKTIWHDSPKEHDYNLLGGAPTTMVRQRANDFDSLTIAANKTQTLELALNIDFRIGQF